MNEQSNIEVLNPLLQQALVSGSAVYNMDCMEFMKQVPDKFFHLAIVDPPYGINAGRRRGDTGRNGHIKQKDYKYGEWDSKTPDAEYFDELMRVSKNQIVWGGNYFGLPASNCWLVWNKKNGENLYADCELAWTSFDTAVRMFEWRWHGFLQEKAGEHKQQRIHPTERPFELYRWILQNYSSEGDLILDTHLGSGSSRIAAHKEKRVFCGLEIDKDYFEAQEARWKNLTAQLSIF